jgi:DNA replication protein DnaC
MAGARTQRLLEAARIPARYQDCSLANFHRLDAPDGPLTSAYVKAEGFLRGYPHEKGLLLVGHVGVGKTHLAVGIIRELIENRGIACLFCDYRELLKEIQNSYNASVQTTELEVLRPVFDAEVLVLDELGAVKPTEWVWDTVSLILNTRYNDKRTTIITTNFPNAPALENQEIAREQRAARKETLGDRIGERMRSRIQEMCIPVEMPGRDYRQRKERTL